MRLYLRASPGDAGKLQAFRRASSPGVRARARDNTPRKGAASCRRRPPARGSGAMRLLIIEDDPVLATTLAQVLRDEGHDVVLAADGLEGWRALEDRVAVPDVILLDMVTPETDGESFRVRQRTN